MKKIVNMGCIFLVFVLLISLLAGCTTDTPIEGQPTQKPSDVDNNDDKTSEIDTSEEVELTMYLMGAPPEDYDKVMAVINEKLKEDINATLKIKYIGWTDWSTQYNLALTSGEPIDIMYASSWSGFNDHVQKGAFLPLDDLLPIYAPESYSQLEEMDWLEASYEGSIYGVPRNFVAVSTDGIVYRGDLAKKYGITVNSLDSLEEYMQAVVDDPDVNMIPFNLAAADAENLFWIYMHEYGLTTNDDFSRFSIVYDGDMKNPGDISLTVNRPDFEEYLHKMRKWHNNGFWSKSALSNNVLSREAFEQGQSAITFGHLDRANGAINAVLSNNPEWDPQYYAFVYDNGFVYPTAKMQDAMAIPRSANHPERALMLLELFRNDREYYDLTEYGIEGEHYVLTENGEIDLPEGVTPDNNPFGPSSLAGWGWWRTDYKRKIVGTLWPEMYDIEADCLEAAQTKIFTAFRVNQEPVRTEVAALEQMKQQYLDPLIFGTVDIEQGLETYRTQAERAGIQKVFDEYKAQVDEYLKQIGR